MRDYSQSLIVPSHDAVMSLDCLQDRCQLLLLLFLLSESSGTYRFIRQPHMINNHLLMRMQSLKNLPSLPIPEDHIPLSITTRQEPPVRRETDSASVSGDGVAGETLLSVLAETVGAVDEDLVVEGLGGEPFFCGYNGHIVS